jgi:glycerate-2-kinase
MEESLTNSFLKKLNNKKSACPPWQGHTIASGSNDRALKMTRTNLDGLFDHVLTELDPYNRVLNSISFDGRTVRCGGVEKALEKEGKILVVGAGKASHQMAKALHDIFGERASGLVTTHKDLGALPRMGNISFQPSGHPNPDAGSVKGAQEIIKLLESAGAKDIVFSLISGGGSAMMELPVTGVSLEDYITVNELLNHAGFDIVEWNAVRKHLSQVKGGQLAKRAEHAAQVFNLIVSDVKGDKLDVIASGPFVADSSTFEHAGDTLSRLAEKVAVLGKDIPSSVMNYIRNNLGAAENETLKIVPPNVVNLIIAGNNTAIDLSAKELESLGIQVSGTNCIRDLSGDIEDAAIDIYSHLLKAVNANPDKPAAVIAGGEATVDVTRYTGFKDGASYGGRMQMMAGLMLCLLEDLPVAGLFAATDCRDGKSPPGMPESAGALVDGATLRESRNKKIDVGAYINACNTYEMHDKLSTQIIKDRFITNVMDLVVLVYLPGS